MVFTAGKSGRYAIEVTDVAGRVLLHTEGMTSMGENKVTLDVSRFASGFYFINLMDEEHGRRILKLSKE